MSKLEAADFMHACLPYFSEPPEILPFDFGKTVLDEGDFAHLSCIVTKGDVPINIRGDSVAKAFLCIARPALLLTN